MSVSVRGHRGIHLRLIVPSREPVKKGLLFSWLLITFIRKSNPNTVAHFVLERMPSRKFYQSHSLWDALVYRHSLPVDSTPAHGLSISPFLSILLILSFTATWQIHSPLTSHHSARAPVSFPPKIKKKKKNTAHIPVPTFPLATLRDHT